MLHKYQKELHHSHIGEGRRRKTEDGSQKLEDRRWGMEFGRKDMNVYCIQ